MRTLSLLLLLFPVLAQAAPSELVCDPDARITFHNRWFRGSVVKLEADVRWDLPWTGREDLVSGKELRAERVQDFETTEAAASDELLNVVPEETRFVKYKVKTNGPSPLESVLYVDQALLEKGEHDGLVISQQLQTLEIADSRPSVKVKVFHCRSR